MAAVAAEPLRPMAAGPLVLPERAPEPEPEPEPLVPPEPEPEPEPRPE
jgi:hypothetical protein